MSDFHPHPDLADLQALPPCEFERLPLSMRVVDRLTLVLLLADEILGELATEEANAILWLEPQIRRVYAETDAAIGRLAQ